MAKRIIAFLFLLLPFIGGSGCDTIPKDPQGTLQQATNGTLQVGYSENPPWVIKGELEPTGREPELIKVFAKTISADIQWHQDTEQHLLEALEKDQLHLVVAGLTDDSPWKKNIAFTRPYLKLGRKKHVFAVIMGENALVTSLEKFLHQQEDDLKKRYGRETSE